MTTVSFLVEQSRIVGFDVQGHSGWGEEGSDIVCAAVTSAIRLVESTVNDVMGLCASLKVREKDAKISFRLPGGLSAPAESTACQTSFCGRAPIPNLNILIFSGRISSRSTWTKPLKSSTADNAVSAVYDFLQCGRHMPPCTAFLLHSER